MRDQLVGYLLGALDAAEQAAIEAALETDLSLRSDLERLSAALPPLASDRDPYEPPAGLADRTVRFVESFAGRLGSDPATSVDLVSATRKR